MMPASTPSHAAHRAAAVLLLAPLLVACAEPRPRGWRNQPIAIQLSPEGIPLAEVVFGDEAPRLAAIDSGSPLTVVKDVAAGRSRSGELRLQDGAHPDVTRFIFFEQEVFDLRVDQLGLTDPVSVRALLGWTVLHRFAVDLSYGAQPSLILRDSIPDSEAEIASDCDTAHLLSGGEPTTPCAAVVNATSAGGGLAQIAGNRHDIPASRLVVPACLAPATVDPKGTLADIGPTGMPVAAVIATGLGTSVISRSAFERLRIKYPVLTESAQTSLLQLPYGAEPVTTTVLPGLAVVANATRDLGPCGELARRQRLLLAAREGVLERDRDQSGASSVQLTLPLSFAIVSDESPLLAGLRNELRPTFADIDVVLGGSVLSRFRLGLDYPAERVILECDPTLAVASCRVLPFCAAPGQDGPPCA